MRVSRREFLTGILAAAAAAVLPKGDGKARDLPGYLLTGEQVTVSAEPDCDQEWALSQWEIGHDDVESILLTSEGDGDYVEFVYHEPTEADLIYEREQRVQLVAAVYGLPVDMVRSARVVEVDTTRNEFALL